MTGRDPASPRGIVLDEMAGSRPAMTVKSVGVSELNQLFQRKS